MLSSEIWIPGPWLQPREPSRSDTQLPAFANHRRRQRSIPTALNSDGSQFRHCSIPQLINCTDDHFDG
ncbi:MAG TPA: hypothetical protein DDY43_04430 [Synechococcales bacterium UBA10510]|nr:hypothetical protein [Synechococcales bacterium UBA10510]